jgi:hypothetical protein
MAGCDEAQVRDATSTRPLVFTDDGMRLLVTPTGLARVYERASPEGFRLEAERREIWREEGIVIEAGPLFQTVQPSTFAATAGDNAVDWETVFVETEVIVPVRVTRGADVRICRKALTTEQATIDATASLAEGDTGPRFVVPTAPVLGDEGWTIRDVGSCSQGELPVAFDLESALTTYLRDAFVVSTVDALETSPLETLGVVLGRLEVRRASAFEPNRGTIVVEGSLPEDGAAVSAMGLAATIDAAIDVDRAGCAPPLELPAISGGGADAIALSDVDADADVAVAVSESVLNRVVHVITLGGFACRGYEDGRADTVSSDVVATDDLLLDEIGLGDLPLGDSSRVVFRPGALPVLTLRPDRGDLLLEWNGITVEIYSELFGVPTRLATVRTAAEVTLSPEAGAPGSVAFAVETINVTGAELTSELAERSDAANVRTWTRRTLLVALSDLFSFPLPLAPGNAIEVTQTAVRPTDLLISGRL